jgi:amidase
VFETSAKLPIGLQFIADVNNESLLIRLAHQFEAAFPWAGRKPEVHVSNITSTHLERLPEKEGTN